MALGAIDRRHVARWLRHFVLGVAMPIIIAQFHIRPDMVGLIGASLVFGAVIGAGVGGPMADHLGRKKLMLADMMIIAAGACISALAKGPAMLFIGQLLVGTGVGIDFPVSSSYVSEILPKPSRARMMVATIACQSVGMLLAATVTLLLLRSGSAQAWRLFLATEAAIAVLFFVLRLSAPESPHWLMSRGKFAEAARAFIRIIPEQRQAVLQLTGNHEKLGTPVLHVDGGLSILFSRRYRARTALVTIPWFLMDIATYGVGLFTPTILGAIEISGRTHGLTARDFAVAKGSAIIDLFLLFGFLLGIWMVPRFGRIRMQAIGFFRNGCGDVGVSVSCRPNKLEFAHPAGVRRVHLFNLLMNAGPNSTTFTLAPHIPDAIAGDSRWICRRRCETRRNVGRLPSANLKRKIRGSERSWNCIGCKCAGSNRYLNPRTRGHRVATLPSSRDGSGK